MQFPGLEKSRRIDGVASYKPSGSRRKTHRERVTGVCTRTDKRSLETMGSNATGSCQTDRAYKIQRPKHGEGENTLGGLTTVGNIEGKCIFPVPEVPVTQG